MNQKTGKRRLRNDAVPTVFSHVKESTSPAVQRRKRKRVEAPSTVVSSTDVLGKFKCSLSLLYLMFMAMVV